MNINIVQAIKLVRSLCPGMGLKEAKEAVEAKFLGSISVGVASPVALDEVVLLAHKTAVEWAVSSVKNSPRIAAMGDVVVLTMTLEEVRIATALFGALSAASAGDEVYNALREYLAARIEFPAELETVDGEHVPVICIQR